MKYMLRVNLEVTEPSDLKVLEIAQAILAAGGDVLSITSMYQGRSVWSSVIFTIWAKTAGAKQCALIQKALKARGVEVLTGKLPAVPETPAPKPPPKLNPVPKTRKDAKS